MPSPAGRSSACGLCADVRGVGLARNSPVSGRGACPTKSDRRSACSRQKQLRITRPAASGRAYSLRASSSPNRTRCAGVRFGFMAGTGGTRAGKRGFFSGRLIARSRWKKRTQGHTRPYLRSFRLPAGVQPRFPTVPSADCGKDRPRSGSVKWNNADFRSV